MNRLSKLIMISCFMSAYAMEKEDDSSLYVDIEMGDFSEDEYELIVIHLMKNYSDLLKNNPDIYQRCQEEIKEPLEKKD
jgi:hypothetical protein